jgi:hypothetical protein
VVTGNGSQLYCVDAPAATPAGCIEYAYNQSIGGTNYFYSLADAQAAKSASPSFYRDPLFQSTYAHGSISEHDFCPMWHYKEVCVDGVWVPLAAGCASVPGGSSGGDGVGGGDGDG